MSVLRVDYFAENTSGSDSFLWIFFDHGFEGVVLSANSTVWVLGASDGIRNCGLLARVGFTMGEEEVILEKAFAETEMGLLPKDFHSSSERDPKRSARVTSLPNLSPTRATTRSSF